MDRKSLKTGGKLRFLCCQFGGFHRVLGGFYPYICVLISGYFGVFATRKSLDMGGLLGRF